VSISTALAIYFLIWWVTLFAVLPFGVRPQLDDKEPGTDPGAPVAARVLSKLLWTTLVSGVIFAVCAWLYINRLVTLEVLIRWMGLPL
jgi:predicted secreted protein